MNRKYKFWAVLWLLLVIVTGMLAFGYGHGGRGYGTWYGSGHMGGWHHGYEDGYDRYGAGSGMMDGDVGNVWGMGRFQNMMTWLHRNLTEAQEKKAAVFLAEAEKSSRKLRLQQLDAQGNLAKLYTGEQRDWNAIRAAANQLSEIRNQEMKAMIDTQQKMDSVLTDAQRADISRFWHGDVGYRER